MPTYQYACTDPVCDHRFEQFQSFTDAALTGCPVCSGRLRKVYGSVGVVFKGSGFYRNDSRAEINGAKKKTSDSASDSGSSTNSTSSSSESSSESGSERKDTSSTRAASGSSSNKSPDSSSSSSSKEPAKSGSSSTGASGSSST